MRLLFSLRVFGARVTNPKAHQEILIKFIRDEQVFLSFLSDSLYAHGSDLFVHLSAVFSSCHL